MDKRATSFQELYETYYGQPSQGVTGSMGQDTLIGQPEQEVTTGGSTPTQPTPTSGTPSKTASELADTEGQWMIVRERQESIAIRRYSDPKVAQAEFIKFVNDPLDMNITYYITKVLGYRLAQ